MENPYFELKIEGRGDCLWRLAGRDGVPELRVQPPRFEVDRAAITAELTDVRPLGSPHELPHGVAEHVWEGRFAHDPGLGLRMTFRVAADSPVVRFRYTLTSDRERQLTKRDGADALDYLGVSLAAFPRLREVRFSEFRETVHSFCLSEIDLSEGDVENGAAVMGPMLVARGPSACALLAYEHGSQAPDAFLRFRLAGGPATTLSAVKGNYVRGQRLVPAHPFETIWFHAAVTPGGEDTLARDYRHFVLERLSPNRESRRPYIFYNSWAFQERNKWWNGKAYLDSMNEERLLAEIDVAHRMGIDVFVLDTGWYEKTGDWQVSRRRFPRGLGPLKERLDRHGMKLGLWFDPLAAAGTSRMLAGHRDCVISRQGKRDEPQGVWETEPSHRMCLVSRYADAFADELVRLTRELGVTYFKWDAIHQYGCDAPGHAHGDADASEAERADAYAFGIGPAMIRVVDKLCAACPQAIVDFDITEGHRFVGLGFLAAGKYFLVNNGPYFPNYDIPYDWSTAKTWSNVFVHPGPARGWICRTPLTFDKWVPSVLFLTHYLPDDPASSQLINLGSLMLGQNGIWGDLLSMSEEGVARFRHWLDLYKHVRDDITRSFPVLTGTPGGSPEIHEKIDPNTGRGLVAAFASAAGTYDYVTRRRADPDWAATEGVDVRHDARGRARLRLRFENPGARFVLFGVRG